MTRYGIAYTTVASTVVYVEAADPDQARTAADEQFEPPEICAQCGGWGRKDDEDAPNSGIELADHWEQDDAKGGVWEA